MKPQDVIATFLERNLMSVSHSNSAASSMLSALSAAGFKVVPVEATEATLSVGEAAFNLAAIERVWFQDRTKAFALIYRAMIEAGRGE